MLINMNDKARSVVVDAICRNLSAIRGGITNFHQDSSLDEELNASIRLTRTVKCAATMIGSSALNQIASFQEEVLETVARKHPELGSDTLSLVTTFLSAMDSYANAIRPGPHPSSGVDPDARQAVTDAVEAYGRYRSGRQEDGDTQLSLLTASCDMSRFHPDDIASFLEEDSLTHPNGSGSPGNASNGKLSSNAAGGVDSPPNPSLGAEAIPDELLEVFVEEAQDHLSRIQEGLRRLQENGGDRALVQDVRRAAHTLKGAAGAVGLRDVTRLAHRMEDLLDQVYDGAISITPELTTLLLTTTDALNDLCLREFDEEGLRHKVQLLYAQYEPHLGPAEGENAGEPRIEGDALSDHVTPRDPSDEETPAKRSGEGQTQDKNSPRRATSTLRVAVDRLDALRDVVSELKLNRASVEQRMAVFTDCLGEMDGVVKRLRLTHRESEMQSSLNARRKPLRRTGMDAVADGRGRAPVNAPSSEFDELEFDRYTESHLVSYSLEEATEDLGEIHHVLRAMKDDIDSMLKRQSQLARDAQHRLVQTRMEPVRAISSRLHRTLREVATNQNKRVELFIECEELELDKTVLDGIVDPLIHLLRNSVDHGIEPPDVRRATGKPEKASVRISGSHHGTQAVLRISDDGQGLDLKKIRDAAVAAGHLDADTAESLSPRSLLSYIFLPGFSTASHVTEISGRGVGMDIVRSKIRDLHGTVEVESNVGQGTTFTICLPMTLAVTRALIVAVGKQTFAIPMQAVDKIARLKRDEIDWDSRDPSIRIDGTEFSVFPLAERPGRERTSPLSASTVTVIVLRSADRDVAVCVDAIVSTRDIVIKALSHHLRNVRGLIGVTLLGDGSVAPIIDPMTVVTNPNPPIGHGSVWEPPPDLPDCDTLTVLSVDDSVSVRRVMKTLIEYAGWNAVTAKDGVDALDKLAALPRPPDMVLLDVEMPRMDGFELLSTLREQPEFADTPIVMITSRSGKKHRQKALRLGATDYAVKPIGSETLTELIRRHVV